MTNLPQNATGWSELMDGQMISAVYTMFNEAFLGNGIIIVILFLVYQFMLYQKTQNVTLMWITGIMFASLYAISTFVEPFSVQILFFILVLELAAIFFLWLMGRVD